MSAHAARAQLAIYRQQLAAVEAMGNSAQTQALRTNLLEVIQMLCEDLGETPPKKAEPASAPTNTEAPKPETKKKNTEIWEDLSKDREQEDAVSSDDDMFSNEAWDKGQKRKQEAEEQAKKLRRLAAATGAPKFASAGKLDPADLKRAMMYHPTRSSEGAHRWHKGEEEGRISAEERKKRKMAMLEERKAQLLAEIDKRNEAAGASVPDSTTSSFELAEEEAEMEISSESGDEGQEDGQEEGKEAANKPDEDGEALSSGDEEGEKETEAKKEEELDEVSRHWGTIYAMPETLTEGSHLGKWEKGTRGVATHIMRRMGYVHGGGLGADGEGIMHPVMARWKTDKQGIGMQPEEDYAMVGEEKEKRRRGGRKKWTSEKQRLKATGETEEEAAQPAGVAAVLQSSLMNNYGKAMGRANIDGLTAKDLPSAVLHTREALALAQKQIDKLRSALTRNANNESMKRELQRKLELVQVHVRELQGDERMLLKRQDVKGGASKKLKGKDLF